MISLIEILHTIGEEKKSGLIPVEDWRWPDVDHLANMGFGFTNDYYMQTNKPPEMKIYKKKDKSHDGKEIELFYLEEKGQPPKQFNKFNDLIDFFDTYSQPSIDKHN